MQRQVVLVDEQDNELGTAEIFKAHQGKGLKHRALSVVLYRQVSEKMEVLLQKRAKAKPVFRDLWSNTCCTNMRPGDEYLPRAVSRLREEMGIKIKQEALQVLYKFSYEALDITRKGWCENELDTVIVGEWDGEVVPNPEEASDYKWMEWGELQRAIEKHSEQYSPWIHLMVADSRMIGVVK